MEGLPREKINMIKNLQDMIVCKHSSHSRHIGNNQIGKLDILHLKDGTTFVAQVIAYAGGFSGAHHVHTRWTSLIRGSSEDGVINALEDLWNKLQGEITDEFKTMRFGQRTTEWHTKRTS
ncbi:hypothetical protein EKO04_005978 [Ascochyta lentis]|uniref:Uncharacterized protein n=1 Tax=Ascochyta lentis TaxID=205686 RepID=A0A8H7J0V6_9PLEO|nr:hypothetical protein EKO04_005978 [Ascochyta lentis]